jgi:transposase-like protein
MPWGPKCALSVVADTKNKPRRIVRSDGRHLTVNGLLLPPESGRWSPRLKFEVVAAVERGLLSTHEACQLYGLTVEELLSWQNSLQRHGYDALKTTQVQKYRPSARQCHLGRRRERTRVLASSNESTERSPRRN